MSPTSREQFAGKIQLVLATARARAACRLLAELDGVPAELLERACRVADDLEVLVLVQGADDRTVSRQALDGGESPEESGG